MMLLVTTGHPQVLAHRTPSLGRLVQPRHYSSIAATAPDRDRGTVARHAAAVRLRSPDLGRRYVIRGIAQAPTLVIPLVTLQPRRDEMERTLSEVAASILINSAPCRARPLRVCRRCGIEGRVAAEQAEPICSERGMVTSHSYVDGTGEQAEQLHQLRACGWRVDVFGARDRLILVKGRDHAGDPFRGHITDAGVLFGEPEDPARRPQRFGRSLSSDPVDAWIRGPQPDAPTFEKLQQRVATALARLELVDLDGDQMDVDAARQSIEDLRTLMGSSTVGRIELDEARR